MIEEQCREWNTNNCVSRPPPSIDSELLESSTGGTCSTPVRSVPYEPAAHALRPWYYTASRGQRRVCEAEIERVVAGGGPSGVLLRGKGMENHSGYLGTI
jgi:hypothetical protein